MTQPPTLTIGLPVYNAGPYLEDALRSILAQSFADWELIVVDDGSWDSGPSLLKRLDHPRVRVLCDDRHLGLASRLNQIVHLARGHYVARMDADDLADPARLERQVDFLRQHPEVDGVGCSLLILDRQLHPSGVRVMAGDHDAICAHPLRGFGLAHATFVARTEWLRRHPYGEANRRCEDLELWLSSYRPARFANLPGVLYYYREFDSFSLAKYARSKWTQASVLWRHRQQFGWAATLAAILAQQARLGVYVGGWLVGLEDRLIRRRSRPVDPALRAQFAEALQRIRAVSLPL